MELGNQILKYRKKLNLSQEELAEKLNVTRQTISKWELGETTPDIKQAKELSKIFKVSLDELTDNDISNIIVKKVSNTEQLAGIIIKILKFIGIAFIILLVIDIISLILFGVLRTTTTTNQTSEVTINCNKASDSYLITVGTDGYYNCSNCSKEIQNDINKIIDYSDLDITVRNIENYFKNINGTCE